MRRRVFQFFARLGYQLEHLQNIYKFGEYNKTPKYFRADHFRQHLKHSHVGTNGKWTSILENASMKNGPPFDAPSSTAAEAGEPSLPAVQTPASVLTSQSPTEAPRQRS